MVDFTNQDKAKLDGIEARAEVNVQSDWGEVDSTEDDFIKNKPNIPGPGTGLVSNNGDLEVAIPFTSADKSKLDGVAEEAQVNVQPDWNQTITVADDYIKNKPAALEGGIGIIVEDEGVELATKAGKLNFTGEGVTASGTGDTKTIHIPGGAGAAGAGAGLVADGDDLDVNPGDGLEIESDKVKVKGADNSVTIDSNGIKVTNPFTDADETKLDGIATGAEVNVQSDWNQTTTTADDYIKNKPDIAGALTDAEIGEKAFKNAPSNLTASEKEDVRSAIQGSKLTKSVAGNTNITLTKDESTYRSIRFTGALTGNIIVVIDAIAAGVLVLDNGTTGSFTLKVKATGQADSTAVTLESGVQLVRHSGTVISELDIPDSLNPRGAGDGLTLDGNDLDVNLGDGLEIASDKVKVKGADNSVTIDSNGIKVTNPFTDADETKLDGIATGAEVNVQADWDATSGDAEILNKPTIPTVRGAGDGLVLDGNDLDVNPGDGLEIASDKVKAKANTGITVDSSGISVTNPFTDADETKLDGISAGAEVNPTFTHGLKLENNEATIDESAFDDSTADVFYTYAASSGTNLENGEFAISNADGSTFYTIGDTGFDWSTIPTSGRIYYNISQFSGVGPFGGSGNKSAPSFVNDDKWSMQPANPLKSETAVFTLSSGPTVVDSSISYVSYDAYSFDNGFGNDNLFYRVAEVQTPIVQIDPSGVKGGDDHWVRRDADNLDGFEGAFHYAVVVDGTDTNPVITEQPYDDFQQQISDIDTPVRFASFEKVNDNLDSTLTAGQFSMQTASGDEHPVILKAHSNREASLIGKFFKIDQRLIHSSWESVVIKAGVVNGDKVLFSVNNAYTAAGGTILPLYSLGRDLLTTQTGVLRKELEGTETDRYASYNNAFVGSNYRRGDWCLFTDTNGPPTTANAIGQPDIADRDTNGVVAFGKILRADKDPNNLVWAAASSANDYKTGDIIYASVWDNRSAYVKITLTSNGVLVDETGDDADYIWCTATWDEVNNIEKVGEFGDYMLLSEEEPSDIDIRIPSGDIVDPPWIEKNISSLDLLEDGDIFPDDEMIIRPSDGPTKKTTIGEIFEYHDESHTGVFSITGLIYSASNDTNNMSDNDVNFAVNSINPDRGILKYKYPNTTARDSLKKKLISGKEIHLATTNPTATVTGDVAGGNPILDLNGAISVNLVNVVRVNTPADNASAVIDVNSSIPSTDQLTKTSFKEEVIGDAGRYVETDGSGDTRVQTPDTAPTASSTKLVTSGGIKTAIDNIDALPDQSGHGGEYLKTDGTDADWAVGSVLNFYDSGALEDDTSRTVSDTDSIQVSSITAEGILVTEDITDFGRVYKTSALKSISFVYNFNATQGVAFQVRYSTTKPTGSTDAKNYGTLILQGNANINNVATVFDVAANTYFWFNLSGGGTRTVNQRDLRVRAAYEASASGDVTGVTAGDGLTGGGQSGSISLAVNPGDGLEIVSDKVKAKANTGITVDSSGISVTNPFTDTDETKLDGIAEGAQVNVQADWDASSGSAEILNKPTIPTVRGAGDGLVLDGNDLDVNPGDGIEIDSDKVRVKLDGSSLTRGANGLKVTNEFTDADETKLDGIATGAEVNPSDSDIGDKAFSNPPTNLTSGEKEDVLSAVLGSKLIKSVVGNTNVTLTKDESTYRSIRFTGALTGNIIVTINAIGAGVLVLDNGTTGSFTLKVKATGQADSTAVTLESGTQIVKHSGTAVSEITTGGNTLTDAEIGDKAFSNPPTNLTSGEKEDVLSAIVGSKLTKNVAGNTNVTLTKDESTYRSIRFTGALTGGIIITIDAVAAGGLILDNGTTGTHTLKVKATGQADSTAVTLESGTQIVNHNGTVISETKAKANPPVINSLGSSMSGAITIYANTADIFYGTVVNNITGVTVSGLVPGQIIEVWLTQGPTGGTLTLGSGIDTTYEDAPTLSTNHNKTDILWFGRGPTGATVYLFGFAKYS